MPSFSHSSWFGTTRSSSQPRKAERNWSWVSSKIVRGKASMSDESRPPPENDPKRAGYPASVARATKSVPNDVRIARYSRPVAAITAE